MTQTGLTRRSRANSRRMRRDGTPRRGLRGCSLAARGFALIAYGRGRERNRRLRLASGRGQRKLFSTPLPANLPVRLSYPYKHGIKRTQAIKFLLLSGAARFDIVFLY